MVRRIVQRVGGTRGFFRRVARFIRTYGFAPVGRRTGTGSGREFSDNELRLLELAQDSIKAEEQSEAFLNQHEDVKSRWHDLVLRTTRDKKLADKVLREMINAETDAKIDAMR